MRRFALVAALLASCLRDPDAYRCDRAGGDRACDSAEGARCVQGYCAARVDTSVCPSGLRYTQSAAAPGTCAPVDGDAATDALDVVEDHPGASDVTALQGDVVDAAAPEDAPDVVDAPPALDVVDVVDASARDVVDVPPAMDVVDASARDVVDVPPAMDVVDVPAARDVVDVPDVRDVVDVPDVRDVVNVPDVPTVPPPVQWISPMPNERVLSNAVSVRFQQTAGGEVTVRMALGIDCSRAQTTTLANQGRAEFTTTRGYICLRIEVPVDGRTWISPWRHVVVMGRAITEITSPRWGRWPDFNNDGYADLLLGTASSVRVFRYTTSGGIGSGESVSGPLGATGPAALAAVGDMDGDSYGDAVITWNLPGRRREVYLHRGGASGLGGPSLRLSNVDDDATFGDAVFPIGDRGADGRADVALLTAQGRYVRVFSLNAAGQVVEGGGFSGSFPYTAFVGDADMDGDGRPDIAYTNAGTVWVALTGGAGVLQVGQNSSGGGSEFGRRLGFGSDIDGDGRSELVVLSPAGDEAHVYRWNRMGFELYTRWSVPGALTAGLVATGDVNNDSVDDFVTFTAGPTVRLHRGGYTNVPLAAIPWREPVGLILAGAADSDTNARVWGAGTSSVAPSGFIVYPYNGANLTQFDVNVDLGGPVTLVSP